MPALDDFQPAADALLGRLRRARRGRHGDAALLDADYAWVTEQVKAVADRHAGGRIVSMLEGGYALSALGRSVVQHLRVLAGSAELRG